MDSRGPASCDSGRARRVRRRLRSGGDGDDSPARHHLTSLLEGLTRTLAYEEAHEAFVSRAALHRMLTEDEVAAAIIAMLHMPGLCAADIDLSAGMVAC